MGATVTAVQIGRNISQIHVVLVEVHMLINRDELE